MDDIDGEHAESTVAFGFGGTQYEIDLSSERAAELEAALAKYIAHPRRTGGSRVKPVAPAVDTERRDYLASVRQWAIDHGHPVAARGRIAATIIEAFEAAKEAAPAAKPGRRGRTK